MAKDPVLKLAKQAKSDPSKVLPLLEASIDLDPATAAKLENAPKFNDAFLEAQAEKVGSTTEQLAEVAAQVSAESPVFVEQRTWEVDADVKESFRALYERDIRTRHTCREMIQIEEERQRKQDGKPVGRGEKISVWTRCGVIYESFQHALVHQSLHLMFDSKDERTRRAMLNDVRELIYPTREKGVRAALTTQERRRMMDSRLKQRLLRD